MTLNNQISIMVHHLLLIQFINIKLQDSILILSQESNYMETMEVL